MSSTTKSKPIETTKTITSPVGEATTIQIHSVKTKRARNAGVAVLQETDDAVREQVGGFVTFIREHAIVGLAVGFIIGTQAQTVVKQLVTSFIDPMLKLIFGAQLSTRKFTVSGADFTWGAMIYALINLLFVLLAIYILVKILKLDKLDKPKTSDTSKPALTKKK